MADYRDRLDEWREAARRKARELDEKYGIKDRVEGGARVASDAARRGAEKVAGEAARAREALLPARLARRQRRRRRHAADDGHDARRLARLRLGAREPEARHPRHA